MVDILYNLILNQNIIDEKNINYTEKPVTKRLSQTTNDFYNI
jgi:hypothetical protein